MQIFNDNDLKVKVLDQIMDQACGSEKQLFTASDIIGISLKILQLVPQSDSILIQAQKKFDICEQITAGLTTTDVSNEKKLVNLEAYRVGARAALGQRNGVVAALRVWQYYNAIMKIQIRCQNQAEGSKVRTQIGKDLVDQTVK